MTSAKTAGRYFLYKANTFYYILFDTNIITETRIFVKDLRRADLDKFFRRVKLKNNKTDISDFFTQAHNDDLVLYARSLLFAVSHMLTEKSS